VVLVVPHSVVCCSHTKPLQIDPMRMLREMLLGASTVILDPFAGDPVGQVTVTLPSNDDLAGDFGRVSADLARAMDKVRNATQLELAL
jgi:hypothetical protein